MQKEKINDLEIDLKELRYLLEGLDKEPMLARSAKRLIDLMKERLDNIKAGLNQPVETEIVLVEGKTEYVPEEEQEDLKEEENLVKEKSAVLKEVIVVPETIEIKAEPQTEDDTSGNDVISKTVLGEQLRPALELSKGLTLNDTFRFSRELFGGDKDYMNNILQEISTMNSLADVVSYLSTHIEWDEENDATQDFIELLKKYFV